MLILLLCLLCTFGCTKKGDDSLKGNINIKEETGKDNRLIYFITNKNKEFINKIDKVANCLKFHGIKKGDVVTICMPNVPEGIISYYAINKIGAISNMVHPLSSE